MKKGLILLIIMVMCFSAASVFANGTQEGGGKEFPTRTIEVIHPWGPGSAMSVSQLIAAEMGNALDVSMTVISTPGAAGTKGFQTAMNKPADGYTIFDGYVAPLVLQPILGNADWDYNDFKPLYPAVSNAFSIACRPDETRWSNFDELVEYGQAHPGELRYSSGSRNNLPHMVIAKVLQECGVVAQQIPYTQDGNSDKDLKSKVLDFAFLNVANYLKDPDSLKILLVLSELPGAKATFNGAPSFADLDIDLGLSDLGPMGWTWWLVRKETPDDVTEILRDAMAKAMANEDVREKISNMGYVVLDWTDEDYEEIVGSVDAQLKSMGDALQWEQDELAKLK